MHEKVMRRLLREAAEVLDMEYDPDGWEYSLTPSDLLLHVAAATWDDGTLRRAVQLLRGDVP